MHPKTKSMAPWVFVAIPNFQAKAYNNHDDDYGGNDKDADDDDNNDKYSVCVAVTVMVEVVVALIVIIASMPTEKFWQQYTWQWWNLWW